MAVAQPHVLLIMANTSGTTVTNHGSVASNGTAVGTENTNWDWNAGPPPYWEAITPQQGSGMPYINLTGIATPTTATQSVWLAIKFRLTAFGAFDTKGVLSATIGAGEGAGIVSGGITLVAENPAGGGNFDLECRINNGTQFNAIQTYAALVFGTDYSLCVALDATTTSAAQPKFKLDAAAVVKPTTENVDSTQPYAANAGWIGRNNEFSNYFGIAGRIYYFAKGFGVVLSDQDMADINSNPSGTIGGWPGGVSGGFLNRNLWWDNL